MLPVQVCNTIIIIVVMTREQ